MDSVDVNDYITQHPIKSSIIGIIIGNVMIAALPIFGWLFGSLLVIGCSIWGIVEVFKLVTRPKPKNNQSM